MERDHGRILACIYSLDKAKLLGTPFLPKDWHPKVLVQIEFPQTGASVQLGNELKPEQGQGDPVVSFVAEVRNRRANAGNFPVKPTAEPGISRAQT